HVHGGRPIAQRAVPPETERRRLVAVAGHAGDEAVARAALDDEAASVRSTALGALARMQRLTTEDLVSALAAEDATVRRRACELAADTALGLDLSPMLGDREPLVAEMAAWAMGERGDASQGVI